MQYHKLFLKPSYLRNSDNSTGLLLNITQGWKWFFK